MTDKPILCLDFDGVCHRDTSPWTAAHEIHDGPVDGLFDFIERASAEFTIVIHSSRSAQPAGRAAMLDWFLEHHVAWCRETGRPKSSLLLGFPVEKPPAFLTLDDRALTFAGAWPEIDTMVNFKPWNRIH